MSWTVPRDTLISAAMLRYDMPYVDNTPGADLFDEVTSLIECYIAREDGDDPGEGIAWIPPARAAAACRAEAQRWQTIADRS